MSEPRERNDITKPTDSAAPTETAQPNDPMLPIEANDPTLPIDSTDPREPIESKESSDHSDRRELMVRIVDLGRGLDQGPCSPARPGTRDRNAAPAVAWRSVTGCAGQGRGHP